MSTAAIAGAVGGAVQSAGHFDELISQSVSLFREQQETATRQHEAMRRQSNMHQQDHAEHSHILYDKTIFQQEILAVKEMMRDLWQQKNEVCQTRMICATLMFGCCFSTVSDGFPQLPSASSSTLSSANNASNNSVPSNTAASSGSANTGSVHGNGVLILGLFLTLAVCCLLASISVTLVMYRRLARYDVDRPLRRYRLCGHVHREFWTFYSCQCNRWEIWGLRLMYLGMFFTVMTVLSLQALKYEFVFHDVVWSVEPFLIAVLSVGVAGVTTAHFLFPDNTQPL
jgi:hypothetical protein